VMHFVSLIVVNEGIDVDTPRKKMASEASEEMES